MKTSMTSISLRGLRTFCVAARYGNFRAAGEALFVTPSAVSHQIKALERELGHPLFERSGRDLKLTDTGSALYEEIHPLIEQIAAAVARRKKGAHQYVVRISVQPFFGSELFVPRLGQFLLANPDISVQISTSDEATGKHPTEVDLSIRIFREPPADRVAQHLFPLVLVPAASRELKSRLAVRGRRIIGNFALLVHDSYPRAWWQWAEQAGLVLPDGLQILRLDSMIAVARAAQQGLGAALMPVPVSEAWFRNDGLVRLFDEALRTDVGYYLVFEESRSRDPGVRRLRDWVLAEFAAQQ